MDEQKLSTRSDFFQCCLLNSSFEILFVHAYREKHLSDKHERTNKENLVWSCSTPCLLGWMPGSLPQRRLAKNLNETKKSLTSNLSA